MPTRIVRPAFIPVGPSIAYIELSRGLYSLVSREDVDLLSAFTWYASLSGDSYSAVSDTPSKKHRKKMHRFLLMPAEGFVVDHINGNPLDNRRENLRICTQAENMMNSKPRKHNSSGLKGAHPTKSPNSWFANITVNKRVIYLGSFPTAALAHAAYCAAAKLHHGAFSRTS